MSPTASTINKRPSSPSVRKPTGLSPPSTNNETTGRCVIEITLSPKSMYVNILSRHTRSGAIT